MNMDYLMQLIAKKVSEAIRDEYNIAMPADEISHLIQPGRMRGVDIECRIAFRIAKQARASPQKIADAILPRIKDELYELSSANGYINFKLSNRFYELALSDPNMLDLKTRNERVIIEYPSVNPNKPLHIGHLRNAILGDCLSRLYELAGFKVIRMNYIDDLGLQVAQSLWGYMKRNANSDEKFDHWLGREYVSISKSMENKEVQKEVEQVMQKLEEGNEELRKLNREMCSLCVKAQHETLESVGIFHDVLVWESDIVNAGAFEKGMNILREKNVLKRKGSGKYAGCEVVELSSHPTFKNLKDADKVFIRANGVATYTAKDMSFAMWKFGIIDCDIKFDKLLIQKNGKILHTSAQNGSRAMQFNHAEKVINIIGVEQEYPQQIIKMILSVAGFEKESENYVHISYAHARLSSHKFSGRKGTWMGYTSDELIAESVRKAYDKIKDRFESYGEETKRVISESVGVGAIRYSFTKLSPEKELVFDWDKALNFEGDSGPYLQYSRTRAAHILEKQGIDEGWNARYEITTDAEKQLIKCISMLSIVVDNSIKNNTVHRINDYATELSSFFNKFYAACKVIGEDKNVSETRKRIVEKYIKAMDICMNILGIPIVSKM